jgi:hypothetical protein
VTLDESSSGLDAAGRLDTDAILVAGTPFRAPAPATALLAAPACVTLAADDTVADPPSPERSATEPLSSASETAPASTPPVSSRQARQNREMRRRFGRSLG